MFTWRYGSGKEEEIWLVVPISLDHETRYGQVQQNCQIQEAHACFSIVRT